MISKAIIVLATLLQLIVATQSEGLIRALSELSAFLLVVSLLLIYRTKRRSEGSETQAYRY
ncbi:hypothetical protein F0225_06125 [Vibrio pectenicida]|uniref:O-succinylbenzoic acid--CoA ligase n=1 Tax=Vibrio pectenicida TaxID=62763 RepID=A0A427U2L3_9VIBR|nr:hypothetical protein [Vibrio pectenicida]NOH70917.1 hypothetical protein [Vibrio pectenicida]RSD30910.1 hypothetical protein EJA03_11440 [Vibrio pectenicida]